MRFTLSWLEKYLKTNKSIDDISDKLTMLGIEVSEIIDNQSLLKQFKIAHVVDVQNHPNADRLKLCKVNDGNEILTIVCGAPNVQKDMKAVLAPVGTKMPEDNFVIKKTKIRDIESNGMLCSAKEIGLGEDKEGIIELSSDAKLGNSVSSLYPSEKVIDVEITPNRSDCLGVYGIARDLAASGLGTFIEKKISKKKSNFKSNIKVKISKDAKNACPTFYGRLIKNVKNCESPEWFKKQLIAVGLKPISALVDITNYSTLDFNRPLHIFDADKVNGNINLSLSKGGEKFKALDGENYKLSKGVLIISDDEEIISLGGVIGGEKTSCDLDTKNVFLESAIFDPITIAKAGRMLNILTDARYRFERGVDPDSIVPGIEEASDLISKFCGGEFSELIFDGKIPQNKKKLKFNSKDMETFVGIKIPEKNIQNILKKLGFNFSQKNNLYNLETPSWRHDINETQDIIEEITRIHGYDKIPSKSIYINNEKKIDNRCQIREMNMKRSLVLNGLSETVSWSFMSLKKAQLFGFDNNKYEIKNPISEDLNLMRPSIIPNLIDAVIKNISNGEKQVCLFELGPIFDQNFKDSQIMSLSGLRYGNIKKHWLKDERGYDVFDVKSDLETILKVCKISTKSYTIENCDSSHYHPGNSGSINFEKNRAGVFGEIHPDIIKTLNIDKPIYAFELNLTDFPKETLEVKKSYTKKYFQKVERDFSFIVNKNVEAKSIVDIAFQTNQEIIDNIYIFDVYEGEGVPDGKKSIAISVTLQPRDKTLKDSEIDLIVKKIVDNVTEKTGAILREK